MLQPDANKEPTPRAERLDAPDRKLGMLWNRLWSVVVGLAGVIWLWWYFTKAENPTTGSIVFAAVIGLVLLLVSWHLWRAKDRLSDLVDDPDTPPPLKKTWNK